MGKGRMEIKDWMLKRVKQLKDENLVTLLCNVSSEHYEVRPWTALKLIAFSYWIELYAKIMRKQKSKGKFQKIWYLDLLAGPGTNLLEDTGEVVMGSPIIAYYYSKKLFDKYVLIEMDKVRRDALEKRMKKLGVENVEVCCGDCNDVIKKLPFDQMDHFVAFVDCEGLDVYWDPTVIKLLRKRGDILVTFQTMELNRTLGRAKRGFKDAEKLTAFLGNDHWRYTTNAEDLLQRYMNQLTEYRTFVDKMLIRGENFRYDLILACKKGPYIKAWHELKKKIERLTDKDVKTVLEVLSGKHKTLNDYHGQLTLTKF
ncbi:MAG: three-Cys-motif partner protein TcmP [Candidatus Bathyarchaeia archaeon]